MYSDEPLVELEYATVSVPLVPPVRAGGLVIAARDYCCVRVALAGGSTGEAFVLTRGLDVAGEIGRLVAPELLGAGGAAVERLPVRLRSVGWYGAISRAVSAVSLALLDAHARAAGSPVWRLVRRDPAPVDPPPAVLAIGYVPVDAAPGADEVAEAERAAAAGVRTVKLMGGFAEPEIDLSRIRRVRAAVGDACGVALDVNGAWPLDVALRQLPRLVDADVAFVEEPWAYELGLAGFARLGDTPRPDLAFGEVSGTVLELDALAATGHVRYVRPDATGLGGPAPFIRALAGFAVHGCVVMPHFWPEVHRHLVAGYPGRSIVECVPAGTGGFGLARFVDGLAEVRDGRVVVPDGPGFGYRLDWSAIRRLTDTPRTVLTATAAAR